MGEQTKIEWCDRTASPWHGCQNCYAETMSKRNEKTLGKWGPDGTRVLSKSFWNNCRKWQASAQKRGVIETVFPSICDPFEDWQGRILSSRTEVEPPCPENGFKEQKLNPVMWFRPGKGVCESGETTIGLVRGERVATMDDVRRSLFALIDECPNLLFLLLTKRPGNVREMYVPHCLEKVRGHVSQNEGDGYTIKPRPNVALVASVSDQQSADALIPDLLKCRDLCKYLGVSAEPLVGEINFKGDLYSDYDKAARDWQMTGNECRTNKISFVIAGGESGHNARPCHPDWARSLRDQCEAAGVPFFFKQWGEYCHPGQLPEDSYAELDASVNLAGHGDYSRPWKVGKHNAGRLLDGREHNDLPWRVEKMIAGTIVGITKLKDRTRLTVEQFDEADRERHIDVYPTSLANLIDLGMTVWTQSMMVMLNGEGIPQDSKLWRIRQDWDGYVWTLDEAMHGRVYSSKKD